MKVLGISAFYHDSAAALVCDGEVIAAAQEERFSRKKNDAEFPAAAIAYCLEEGGILLDQLDYVGFYEKPVLTFNRLLETYLAFVPSGLPSFIKAIPVWVKEKILQKRLLVHGLNGLDRGTLSADKLLFGFHHHSHAASAFYPSPFEDAALLVMDGVGEWATTSMGVGSGSEVTLINEIRFPHSLGMLYSAFTYYLGFKINDGEYKVMGLAPYGQPTYVQAIYDNLIDVKGDGSFRLNMDFFNYCTGLTMTNGQFHQLFAGEPQRSGSLVTQREMDLAHSLQVVSEDIVLRLCRTLHAMTGARNLCMAGGVALNCVANGRILREGPFERLWVQPAAGDAGGSIGVAQAITYSVGGLQRRVSHNGGRCGRDGMNGAYLGPAFNQDQVHSVVTRHEAVSHQLHDDELFQTVARALADEKVVGWFQGRMEFGPRSLGNRSIIGDPRSPRMQRMLNLKIKYRESFRPFAPAVLRDDVSEYFELDADSPYMLLVAPVREDRRRQLSDHEQALQGIQKLNTIRSDVPAITHVDYSARIQTVHPETNARFYKLIEAFKARTGCSVLVNTSFNVRDEPIVCSPEDAYRCFMATEMDILVLGNTVLFKEEQGRRAITVPTESSMFSDRILACLKPPGGTDDMELVEQDGGSLFCPQTGEVYGASRGVPSLFPPTQGIGQTVTSEVKSFYEENPFPSYEGLEDFGELVNKGSRNPFSAQLLKAIGHNKLVLECGCGTGQLTHYLQLNNNHVLGIDMSLGSLSLAIEHKRRNGLTRSSFAQMNIFDLAIKDNSFDVVVSHGVLHHTYDAKQAFAHIVRKVKPGGIVMVGLYNWYARIMTWIRGQLIRFGGPNLDYVVRSKILDARKADIWIKDQYFNPHETWHSIDEVIAWFEENAIEYMNCCPPIIGTDAEDAHNLFTSTDRGSSYQRVLTQLAWIGTIAREGSLFDVIGRKK